MYRTCSYFYVRFIYTYVYIYIYICTPAHLYFNITGQIYIKNIRCRSAPYTPLRMEYKFYTLLQVGSLCDIPHIVRWDSTDVEDEVLSQQTIWGMSHKDPTCKRVYRICTPCAAVYMSDIDRSMTMERICI